MCSQTDKEIDGRGCKLRVLINPPGDAYWNMAVDEAVFISHIEGKVTTTLRLYTFEKPSITYGYFQEVGPGDYQDRIKVRRITGGGVVLHHLDQTISLVIKPGDFNLKRKEDLYYNFSRALREGLSSFGDITAFGGHSSSERVSVYECFSKIAPEDLVVAGRKLAGYSQRRRRGFTLLQASMRLYEGEEDGAISLEEICNSPPELNGVHRAIIAGFEKAWKVKTYRSDLTRYERELAERLIEKYTSDKWNFKVDKVVRL
ncbi:MAG: hypothetical protein B6D57_04840 [Candidatus Coatesbacteria bacterium 4484_99]|uniref:BPL/LPL catalytic domain-containing protein n=1 Tax=Candidatus Coatesbacteria bacterium 4484_99 TaxID=1970774 RepID=A0A1W9S001_9BACT|nr:MAG: hypothetical protein B6D57_04840 [Candidatus Coatesbacteria bacterium 4484_99]RLC40738.1 MAG: hypothetical protein DRH51_04800 [Candidatus Coatesbacteria bacterium]RLC44949.1 MAG: hypothetical protein DRH44_00575 [Candidatus Coatesbacteria bacterium]